MTTGSSVQFSAWRLASSTFLLEAPARLGEKRLLAIFFYPSIYWHGVCKHLVANAPSVGIVRCSKNPVDAREKNIQQRAKSLSLAGASEQPQSGQNKEEVACQTAQPSQWDVLVLTEFWFLCSLSSKGNRDVSLDECARKIVVSA